MSDTEKNPASKNQSQKFSERRKKQAEAKRRKKEKKRSKIAINPPYSEVDQLILLYQRGQYDAAERLAWQLSDTFPRYPFAKKILGDLLWQRRKTSEAIGMYKAAAAIDPEDASVHYNLGFMAHDLGKLEEARVRYETAISLNPHYGKRISRYGKIGRC